MYTLFLDDERFPVDECSVIARSFDEAVAIVEARGMPAHIDFDHDLGPASKTGYDFAKWIVEKVLDSHPFPSYAVHSQNPVGKKNILGYLDNAKEIIGKEN